MSKYLLSLLLMAALAQASAAGAQTCDANITPSAPDSRYSDNGDGTVTDNATGLMWKQCAEGLSGPGCAGGQVVAYNWQEAIQQGLEESFAGHTDWRLPNVNELSSLVEERCDSPAINGGFFPGTPLGWFWTSSPCAYFTNLSWAVYSDDGNVLDRYRSYKHSVRLVRGGQ